MRIAIDAMGGDFAPEPIVEGALQALAANSNLHMTLVGDREQIEPLVEKYDGDKGRIDYDHTTEVVGMEESPAKALRGKPNSSINRSWALLAAGKSDAIVSAGNTGAVVAGGLKTRRFLGNIQRPGIAVTVPSPTGKSVMLDVGANVAPRPEHLYHYGVMGTVYARQVLGIEKPTIGLLNIGSEEMKGNDLSKLTAALFSKSPISEQFKGNIEGRDICRGMVDVIVCDGFVGNIVLKCCEGLIEFLLRAVHHEVLGSLNVERDVATKSLMGLHARHHHSEVGGAPLLGIDGVCLICHGGSDAKAIRNAVKQVGLFTEVNRLIAAEASASVK